MSRPTQAELKARIIRRCKKIIRDSEQAIRDINYWNGLPHNQHYTPIDPEPFVLNRAWGIKQLEIAKALPLEEGPTK